MSRTQRRLTNDEGCELAELNQAVAAAVGARRDWLDAKMHETSSLKVGDGIYDLNSGRRLGTVAKLYRYWAGRNDLLDTSVECDYEYETSLLCFDNTSRQIGLRYGTKEEARSRLIERAAAL